MNTLPSFNEHEINPRYYRFFFVTNYSYFLGMVIHASFIFLFSYLNIPFSLATHFIGWESGFYVYLMALIPLTFFNPSLRYVGQIVLAVLIAAFSLALKHYADTYQAAVFIPREIINNLFYINYFFFYVVLAFLSFYYSYAARKSEDALQRSHDKIDQLAR